jgi:hypothetical protein
MTTILIKKKDTAGAPSAGDLTNAAGGTEIAVNTATKRIYTKDSGGNVVELGTNASTSTIADLTVTNTLTVSGTVTSNLIFTDNTYDIGASGATRPRNLFLAGNITSAGNTILGDASTDTVRVNGYMGVGGAPSSSLALYVTNSALTGTGQTGVYSAPTANSSATSAINAFIGDARTDAAAFTVTSARQFFAANITKGSGSTITNAIGFYVEDQTTGTNNFGFSSAVTSGTNKWNIYASGTAQNYFAGSVGVGVAAPAYKFDVLGNAQFASAAGQIIISPTGYRVADRASILIESATNNPAEIDLLNTVSGLNYGWQISSRVGTTPTLDVYRNNNGSFILNMQLGPTENVFNADLGDQDFRVASDTNAYALFVDAGNSRVGINNGTPAFNLDVGLGGINTDTTPAARIGDGSRSLYIQPSIGTSSFYGSAIGWNGYVNSATYQIVAPAGRNTFGVSVAAGEYDGSFVFYAYNVGSTAAASVSAPNVERLRIGSSTELVVNDGSNDYDFRVESDNNTHMLFVDAGNDVVSIGTSTVPNWYGSQTLQSSTWAISSLLGADQAGYSSGCYQDAYGYTTNWKFKGSYPATLYTQTGDHTFWTTSSTRGAGNAITWRQTLAMSDTAVIFNEDSLDIDFRIESDTSAYAFFLDAGTNRVNINNSTAYDSVFTTSATGGYGSGDVNAIFVNPSGRPTVRLRSLASEACELFFDTGGGVAWDISCRSVSEGRQMMWFPSAGTPSYGAVGGQVMTLTQVGNLTIAGALAKGSGSFQIDHPLPSMNETHHLVHSFVEAPQADLYYRGKVALVGGRAAVNIDQVAGMTEGTFVLLNREVQCFTSNESDWDAVRGSVSGNILTIECQNPASTATISWMVVGERQDKHMYDTDWTDENGKVIVEPVKPPPIEPPTFDR